MVLRGNIVHGNYFQSKYFLEQIFFRANICRHALTDSRASVLPYLTSIALVTNYQRAELKIGLIKIIFTMVIFLLKNSPGFVPVHFSLEEHDK